jgi:hypothetical protein
LGITHLFLHLKQFGSSRQGCLGWIYAKSSTTTLFSGGAEVHSQVALRLNAVEISDTGQAKAGYL